MGTYFTFFFETKKIRMHGRMCIAWPEKEMYMRHLHSIQKETMK